MEADERKTMSDKIPVRLVETFEPSRSKMKAKSSDNQIHTRSFSGLFRTLRISGAGFLFLAFFGTVWLNWGGRQAVLWDLAQSKFHIFGATFWPQDFILLSALLIICAFGLFAITVFAGRVWCGYTCPQSSPGCSCGVKKSPRVSATSGSSCKPRPGPWKNCCAARPNTPCGWRSACSPA
jgi:hypothetical protein